MYKMPWILNPLSKISTSELLIRFHNWDQNWSNATYIHQKDFFYWLTDLKMWLLLKDLSTEQQFVFYPLLEDFTRSVKVWVGEPTVLVLQGHRGVSETGTDLLSNELMWDICLPDSLGYGGGLGGSILGHRSFCLAKGGTR